MIGGMNNAHGSGSMKIIITDGQHCYDFDYTIARP